MMHKLSRLEKQPIPPPLLHTPTIQQLPTHFSSFTTHPNTFRPSTLTYIHSPAQTSTNSPPTNNPCLPKLEIPIFSSDHALGWLFQIEQFFHYHNTPPNQHIDVASFYMTGLVLQWFHWLHTTQQLLTWEAFAHDLEVRFGPSSFQNHEGTLLKLCQST